MCVIAASPAGCRQPTDAELRAMWDANPHGAGYMVARNGKVEIRKGFMTFLDFALSVIQECFTDADPVVYHFRISTQAGINPEMTHPFPLTANRKLHQKLDLTCPVGIAHNGIISLTSDRSERTYSDTSLFIAQYMTKIIKRRKDLDDADKLEMIYLLAQSKFCFLAGDGTIRTVGQFAEKDGILLSNENHLHAWSTIGNYYTR